MSTEKAKIKGNYRKVVGSEGQVETEVEVAAGFDADAAPVGSQVVGITAVGEVVDTPEELQPGGAQSEGDGAQGQVESGVASGFLFSFCDLILPGGPHQGDLCRACTGSRKPHAYTAI